MTLRIVYAGTPEFAVPALSAIIGAGHEVCAVYTQPDRPAGRGKKLTPSPVKRRALELGLPVYQPEHFKEADTREELAALAPDLMVVAAYGLLLPQAVLDTPRLGCVNIHASLLPRWRGAAPIQRAIEAGDADTGITIMQMDAGLDTGDMLLKRITPIHEQDTAASLHDRLAEQGAEALLAALPGIEAGTLQGQRQNDGEACYARKLVKSEARIDWTAPAELLARRVRAFNPWPVAQTSLGSDTIRVWAASALSGDANRSPGEVIQANGEGILVACGEGMLLIRSLQRPGGKPVTAREFLNAHDLTGARFA
ncbi:MAG: methionyl-tRNA formyltransferase [Halothiobacillaceae bacterium]